jgi:hypothetical protein
MQQSAQPLLIVEKYERVIAYLYPIIQNTPRYLAKVALLIAFITFASCEQPIDPPSEANTEERVAEQPAPEVTPEPEPEPEPETVCELYGEIETWTIRIIENDCLISQYQWDDPGNDWKLQDLTDYEYTVLLRHLQGWAVKQNKTQGTKYQVQYRRHV